MMENGEIALCTLSAFNLGAINHLDDLEELADLAVRALDALLDYQDYPVKAAGTQLIGTSFLGDWRYQLCVLFGEKMACAILMVVLTI